jgi:hypothetical protein
MIFISEAQFFLAVRRNRDIACLILKRKLSSQYTPPPKVDMPSKRTSLCPH